MAPQHLMASTVTITRRERVEWDTDRLGRPTYVDLPPTITVGRLIAARDGAWRMQPERDGHVVTVWRLLLPAGTDVRDSDHITVDGADYTILEHPEAPVSPLTGIGYVAVTVRRVDDAA